MSFSWILCTTFNVWCRSIPQGAMHYTYCCVFVVLFSILFVALAKAYSLTSFGSCGWLFERLGNVYGCVVALIIIDYF
jgi:hypothetical protein